MWIYIHFLLVDFKNRKGVFMEIKFIVNTDKSRTVLKTAKKNGIKLKAPCGGNGKCGKCIVKVKGKLSEPTKVERNFLSEKKVEKGYRLACEAEIIGNAEIEIDCE